MAEKTVIILAANILMRAASGRKLVVDLNTSKGGGAKSAVAGGSAAVASFSKTAWTCSVEAVCEYSRLVFDLFPHQCQVCLVVCDPLRCNAVNSWRDDDQDLSRVLEGFQTFGPPQGCNHGDGHPHPQAHLSSALQGLNFGLTCLAQLTAPQFALVQNDSASLPANGGRIILVTALSSPGEATEVRRRFVEQYWRENAVIDQLLDRSRLPIKECDFVLVNVGTAGPLSVGSETAEQPLPPGLSFTVHNIAADQLHSQIISLAQSHFSLATTTVTGIPMKEDQSGGNSANYDVELYHCREAHRDILRAGRGLQSSHCSEKGVPKKAVTLKWSTPKPASGLDMMLCASAYRVTPAEVTSRPTVCLVNFLLSGRAVVLEQPRKPGAVRVSSHMLISHGGAIFLHALLQGKSPLEEPPSMTEGLGGRITDYRISDFVELMGSCRLVPHPLDRTLLPQPTSLEQACSHQERCTRVWPLVFSESVLWSMQQELNPLTKCVPEQTISAEDYEQCRQLIVDLQNRENSSESLPLPQSGTKPKASRREEQYRQLWEELEELLHAHHGNSERHAKLFDLVQVLSKESPSNGRPRKLPMRVPDTSTEAMEVEQMKVLAVAQKTTENNTSQTKSEQPVRPLPLPSGAKPVSLLSLWSARVNRAANGKHREFAGRANCPANSKAELYTHLARNYS